MMNEEVPLRPHNGQMKDGTLSRNLPASSRKIGFSGVDPTISSARLYNRLGSVISDPSHPNGAEEIVVLAFGAFERYYVCWRSPRGEYHQDSFGLPDALQEWLFPTDGTSRDYATLQVILGQREEFFAYDKNGKISHLVVEAAKAAARGSEKKAELPRRKTLPGSAPTWKSTPNPRTLSYPGILRIPSRETFKPQLEPAAQIPSQPRGVLSDPFSQSTLQQMKRNGSQPESSPPRVRNSQNNRSSWILDSPERQLRNDFELTPPSTQRGRTLNRHSKSGSISSNSDSSLYQFALKPQMAPLSEGTSPQPPLIRRNRRIRAQSMIFNSPLQQDPGVERRGWSPYRSYTLGGELHREPYADASMQTEQILAMFSDAAVQAEYITTLIEAAIQTDFISHFTNSGIQAEPIVSFSDGGVQTDPVPSFADAAVQVDPPKSFTDAGVQSNPPVSFTDTGVQSELLSPTNKTSTESWDFVDHGVQPDPPLKLVDTGVQPDPMPMIDSLREVARPSTMVDTGVQPDPMPMLMDDKKQQDSKPAMIDTGVQPDSSSNFNITSLESVRSLNFVETGIQPDAFLSNVRDTGVQPDPLPSMTDANIQLDILPAKDTAEIKTNSLPRTVTDSGVQPDVLPMSGIDAGVQFDSQQKVVTDTGVQFDILPTNTVDVGVQPDELPISSVNAGLQPDVLKRSFTDTGVQPNSLPTLTDTAVQSDLSPIENKTAMTTLVSTGVQSDPVPLREAGTQVASPTEKPVISNGIQTDPIPSYSSTQVTTQPVILSNPQTSTNIPNSDIPTPFYTPSRMVTTSTSSTINPASSPTIAPVPTTTHASPPSTTAPISNKASTSSHTHMGGLGEYFRSGSYQLGDVFRTSYKFCYVLNAAERDMLEAMRLQS